MKITLIISSFPLSLRVILCLLVFAPVYASEEGLSYLTTSLNRLSLEGDYRSFPESKVVENLFTQVQQAKAQGDVEALLKIKDTFEGLSYQSSTWQYLSQQCSEHLPYSFCWPNQTYKQHVGAALFYPQELNDKVGDGTGEKELYSAIGLTPSLAIAALYGDPIAVYKLRGAYVKAYYRTHKDEMGPESQEYKRRAEQLAEKALRIFDQVPEGTDSRSVYAHYMKAFIAFHELLPFPSYERRLTVTEYDDILRQLGPYLVDAYFCCAVRAYRMRNFIDAFEYAKKAFPFGPRAYSFAAWVGEVVQKQGLAFH